MLIFEKKMAEIILQTTFLEESKKHRIVHATFYLALLCPVGVLEFRQNIISAKLILEWPAPNSSAVRQNTHVSYFV